MECKLCWVKDNDPMQIFESEFSFSVLCKDHIVPGQMMVLPKRHVESMDEMNADECKDFLDHIEKMAKIVEKEYGTAMMLQQRQHGSEQHLHFQIVPTVTGIRNFIAGEGNEIYPSRAEEEWKEVQERIRRHL